MHTLHFCQSARIRISLLPLYVLLTWHSGMPSVGFLRFTSFIQTDSRAEEDALLDELNALTYQACYALLQNHNHGEREGLKLAADVWDAWFTVRRCFRHHVSSEAAPNNSQHGVLGSDAQVRDF